MVSYQPPPGQQSSNNPGVAFPVPLSTTSTQPMNISPPRVSTVPAPTAGNPSGGQVLTLPPPILSQMPVAQQQTSTPLGLPSQTTTGPQQHWPGQ